MKQDVKLVMALVVVLGVTVSGCGKRQDATNQPPGSGPRGTAAPSASFDVLISTVSDATADSGKRREAVEALAQLDDERAVPALVEVLSGKDDFLSFDALEALGKIGGSGIDALARIINDDASRWGLQAVKELARSDDPSALPILTATAKGKSGIERASARAALRDMKRKNSRQTSPRLAVAPISWPEGAGYLPKPPPRPSTPHDVKKTSTVAEIIAVSGSQFLFGQSSQVEYRESESLFIFPGSQISYYADDPDKFVLSDYNGDKCTLIYGLIVAIDDFGQFVPLKYDSAGF